MRGLPFFKPKNKPQFAGLNFSDASSGGGGGGGNSGIVLSTDETPIGKVGEKNLYSRVFNITSGSSAFYTINAPNIDRVYMSSATAFYASGADEGFTEYSGFNYQYYGNAFHLDFGTGLYPSAEHPIIFTVFYTKVND